MKWEKLLLMVQTAKSAHVQHFPRIKRSKTRHPHTYVLKLSVSNNGSMVPPRPGAFKCKTVILIIIIIIIGFEREKKKSHSEMALGRLFPDQGPAFTPTFGSTPPPAAPPAEEHNPPPADRVTRARRLLPGINPCRV